MASNFGFADWLLGQIERQDAVGTLARAWDQGETGKITSVSGVKRWFTENPGELEPDWVQTTMELAVREYTQHRQSQVAGSSEPGTTPTKTLDRLERIETMLKALESVPGRLETIEQASAWLVDTMSAYLEGFAARVQEHNQATGHQHDWRSMVGDGSSRSEAEAMGLVSPAPPRSSVPGYEHVIQPQPVPQPPEPTEDQVRDLVQRAYAQEQADLYPQPPVDNGPGYPQQPVDNPRSTTVDRSLPETFAEAAQQMAAGGQVPPADQAAIRAAIEAEAARIQGGTFRGSEPSHSPYYDGDVESPAGSPPAAPAAYDWRAMAQQADYSGEPD